MHVEIGTEAVRPRNSFSGNICFEFSVLCICSAGKKEEKIPSPYAISDFRLETLAMDFVYCTNSEVKRPI